MPTATKKRGSQSKSNLKRNEAREKKRDKEVREIWFNPHATEMRESRMGFCNCECQLLRDERLQQELQRIAKVYSQVDTAVEEGEEDEEETQSKGCCGGSKSKKSKVKSSETEPKSDKAPSKNKNAKKGKSKDERDKSKDKKEKSKDKKEKSKDKKEKTMDKKDKSKEKKEKDKTKDENNTTAAHKGGVVKVGSQSFIVYRNCRFKTREEAKRYRELKSIYTTRLRARHSSASTKEKKKDKKSKRKEQSDMEQCPSSSSEESTNAREEKQAKKHKSRKDTEKSSSRRPRPRPPSSNSDYPQESASRQHKRDESKSKQKKKKSGGGCFGRRTKSNDDNDAYRPAQKSSTTSAASNGRSMLPPECPFTPEELELLEKLRATYARDAANKNRQRRAETEPDKADTGCCGSKKKKRTPTEDESNNTLHSQYTHDSFRHYDCRCAENYSTTFKQKYTTCESTSEMFTSNLQSCDAQSCRADKVQYDDHANGTIASRYGAEKEKCAGMPLPLMSESAVLTGKLGNKVNTAQTQTDYGSPQSKSKNSKNVKQPSLRDSNTDTACTCLRYLKMRNKRGTHSETSAEKTNEGPCCENEACTMQKSKHTPTEKGANQATETLIESEIEMKVANEKELLSAPVEKVASKKSMQYETTEQFIESEQCKRLSSERECLCEDGQKVPSTTSKTSVLPRREDGSNTDIQARNTSNKSIETEPIQEKKSDDHAIMRSNSKNQIGTLHKTELEMKNPQILDKDQHKLCQTSSFCTFVKAEPEHELSVQLMEVLSKSNDFRRPSTVEIAEANQRPASKLSIPACCAIRKEVSAEKLDNTTKEIMAYGSDESRASNNNDFENQPLTTGLKNNVQQEQTNESFSCCAAVEKKSSKASSREEITMTASEEVIGRAPSKNPKKCWPIGRKDRSEKSDIVVRRRSTQKDKENDENIESKELPPCCRNGKEFQKQVDSKETQTQFETAQTEMNEIPGKPGACCTIEMKNKKELEYSEIKPPSSGGPDVKNKSFKTTPALCCKTSKMSVLPRREDGSNTDLQARNTSNKSIETEPIQEKKSDDNAIMRSNSKNQIGALHKTELGIKNPQILDNYQQKLCQTSSFCTFVKVETEHELSVHIMEILSKSNDFRRPSTVEIAEANQRPSSKLSIPSCCAIRKEVSPEKLDNTTKEIMAYGSDESRASNNNKFENQPLTTGLKNNVQQEQTNESFSCCAADEKKRSKASSREEITMTENEEVIGRVPSKNPKKCWPIGRKDRSEISDIVVRRRSTQKSKENDENRESKELPPCCRNGKEFQKQVDSNEIPGKPGACCTIEIKNKKELQYSEIKPPSSGGPNVKKKSLKTTPAPCCSEVSESKVSDVKGKDLKNKTSKKSSCCPITYYSTVNTDKSKELNVYEKKPTKTEEKDLKMASFKTMSARPSLPHRDTTKEPKQFETRSTKKEGALKKTPSKTNSCCTSLAPCCPIEMFPGDSEIETFDDKVPDVRNAPPETTEEEKPQQGFEPAENPKKAMQNSTEEHVNKKPTSCCPIGIRHKSKNLQYSEKRSSNDKMPDKLEDKRTRMSREKKENFRERTTFDFQDDIEKVPLSLGNGPSSIVSTESPRDSHKEPFMTKRLENFKQKPLKTSCCSIMKNKRTLCCPIGVKGEKKDMTPTEMKVECLEGKSSKMLTLQPTMKGMPHFEEEAEYKTSEGSKNIIDNEEYKKKTSKSLEETKPKTGNRTGSPNIQATGSLATLERKPSKMSTSQPIRKGMPHFEEEDKYKTSEGSKNIVDNEEYKKKTSKSLEETKPKTWNRTGSANIQPTSPRRELQKIPKRLPDKTFGTSNKINPKKSKRRSKNKENNDDAYKKKPSSLSYCEALYTDLENIFMQRYQRQDILAHTKDFKATYFTTKSSKIRKRNTQQESQTNGKAAKESKDRTNKEIKQEETNETTPNLTYKSYRKEKPRKKIEKINKKENLKSAKLPPPFAPCYATSDSQIKQAYVPEYVLGQTQNQLGGVTMSPSRLIKYTVILNSNAKKKCYKDPDKAQDIHYFYGYGLDCQN